MGDLRRNCSKEKNVQNNLLQFVHNFLKFKEIKKGINCASQRKEDIINKTDRFLGPEFMKKGGKRAAKPRRTGKTEYKEEEEYEDKVP